jgi:hypothetical protein
MYADMDELNRKPADLYLRGHVHGYAHQHDSIRRNGRTYDSQIVICPSMVGINPHARKVTRSVPYAKNGMVIIHATDGRIDEIVPVVDTYDTREYVKLSDLGVPGYPQKGSPRDTRKARAAYAEMKAAK